MKTILNSTINMLKSKLILLIIPLFFSCSENIKTTQKLLNVVWISCEDMGPILGSYGNDVVKTPNLLYLELSLYHEVNQLFLPF